MSQRTLIDASMGRIKADLVITDVQPIDVISREILEGGIAIKEGTICRIGDVSDLIGSKTRVIKGRGRYAAPAFIESHIHVESTMLTLTEFARAVIPHGTGTAIIDPHEIANVTGIRGLEIFMEEARDLPLHILMEVPSCVPAASAEFETTGARLDAFTIDRLLQDPMVIGLGEVMNVPAVLNNDEDIHLKIQFARSQGKVVEGHAPGLIGKELNAYIAAGIMSDHECETAEEAVERLRMGMTVMAREGSIVQNMLGILLPLYNESRDLRNCTICSDDLSPVELADVGHLDRSVRRAIEAGIDPLVAIQLVTSNPARFFNLPRVGHLAPGTMGDIVLIDDLKKINVDLVILRGRLVAKAGRLTAKLKRYEYPPDLRSTIRFGGIPTVLNYMIPANDGERRVRVILAKEGSLITDSSIETLKAIDGYIHPDIDRDILTIAVTERYMKGGNIGVGFVRGFGLKEGAIASSIAHDSHNLISVATSPEDALMAISTVSQSMGGIVAVNGRKILAALPLPIAGLITDEPVDRVAQKLQEVREAARSLGCQFEHPYLTMSFMALPVIPDLKITDKGLVDVSDMKIVPTLVE
ncbi:MAG: adenine deaminase [Candidatus Thorarchaeota archaeon]